VVVKHGKRARAVRWADLPNQTLPLLQVSFTANRRRLGVETISQDCTLAEEVTKPQVIDTTNGLPVCASMMGK